MKRIKSYFINSKNNYTRWGLICNWLLILLPFALIGVMFVLGDKLGGLKKGSSVEELKAQLNGGDVTLTFLFFVGFCFLMYVIIYKLVRLFWKPKHVRTRTKDLSNGKEDKYWGNLKETPEKKEQ